MNRLPPITIPYIPLTPARSYDSDTNGSNDNHVITYGIDKRFGLVLWSPQQDLKPFSPSFSPCTNGHNANTNQWKRILLLTAK